MKDLKEVQGHLIGGEMTSKSNGMIYPVYAYNNRTFEILKKPQYQEALLEVGLKPILNILPWGFNFP